jgi:hypothetical protein
MRSSYRIRRPDGEKVFDGFVLLSAFGWELAVHRFVGADAPNCFHTHYGFAIGWILWGGYVEEVVAKGSDGPRYVERVWFPGRIGWITADYEHRIDHLLNGKSSWTLWLRGPITANITTRGC